MLLKQTQFNPLPNVVFLPFADFSSILNLSKILWGIPSEYQFYLQIRPDLGPNCLQRLSADDTTRQRVNEIKQEKKADVRFCHSELP